jgi:hypothetical protein
MEFSVPAADPSTFFPISVGFSALNTFSSLKVGYIILPPFGNIRCFSFVK